MLEKTTIDLWKAYCYIHKVLTTMFNTNNIEGDFAEKIVADFYGGVLATPSTKAYDFTANGRVY